MIVYNDQFPLFKGDGAVPARYRVIVQQDIIIAVPADDRLSFEELKAVDGDLIGIEFHHPSDEDLPYRQAISSQNNGPAVLLGRGRIFLSSPCRLCTFRRLLLIGKRGIRCNIIGWRPSEYGLKLPFLCTDRAEAHRVRISMTFQTLFHIGKNLYNLLCLLIG